MKRRGTQILSEDFLVISKECSHLKYDLCLRTQRLLLYALFMAHACNSEKRDRGREWAGGGLAEERERKGPEGEIGTTKTSA